MKIFLKKFGNVLISRPSGKEAYLAFQPSLNYLADDESVEIDFEGVDVLTPSWADEFLTPLKAKHGAKIFYTNTENSSVQATLAILKQTN